MPGRTPISALAKGFALALVLFAAPAAAETEDAWEAIRPGLFGERPIADGAGVVNLVVPQRAEDAALVPLDVRLHGADADGKAVKTLTLVVDENPAPVVATFTFDGSREPFDLSMRVRVNSHSFVRAVAETGDGKLYMVKTSIRAAGGCSTPATKDPLEAKKNLGQMRFRALSRLGRQDGQVQLRHPNYSGLQMDAVSQTYVPAWFIDQVTVKQGERTVFRMTGGISISEDPTFRFSYRPNGEPLSVEAKDTDGNLFQKSFPGEEGYF